MKNKHAVALGKLSLGKKKTLTDEERKARSKRMAAAQKKRWLKKPVEQ